MDHPFTVYVDSAEVKANLLFPNLLIFRVIDHKDSSGQKHHGYQVLYTGDFRAAMDGLLSASVVDDNTIKVLMPGVPSSVVTDWIGIDRAMGTMGYSTETVKSSHTTGVNNLVNNRASQQIEVLIKFDNTGETITNEVFSGMPTGDIDAEVTPYESTFNWSGETYHSTDLFVGFKVARVEAERRMDTISQPKSMNKIAEAFGKAQAATDAAATETEDPDVAMSDGDHFEQQRSKISEARERLETEQSSAKSQLDQRTRSLLQREEELKAAFQQLQSEKHLKSVSQEDLDRDREFLRAEEAKLRLEREALDQNRRQHQEENAARSLQFEQQRIELEAQFEQQRVELNERERQLSSASFQTSAQSLGKKRKIVEEDSKAPENEAPENDNRSPTSAGEPDNTTWRTVAHQLSNPTSEEERERQLMALTSVSEEANGDQDQSKSTIEEGDDDDDESSNDESTMSDK